jgi:hypothetical protein
LGKKAEVERTSPAIPAFIHERIESKGLLLDLTLGGLLGFTVTFVAISLVSLIFAGELSQHLNLGISFALLTAVVTLVLTTH